jgi:hypothetical protein
MVFELELSKCAQTLGNKVMCFKFGRFFKFWFLCLMTTAATIKTITTTIMSIHATIPSDVPDEVVGTVNCMVT